MLIKRGNKEDKPIKKKVVEPEETKVHVEELYRVFDNYRRNMQNAVYATDPFLQERKAFDLRHKLKADLIELGFGDMLDFSFRPMPPAITCGVSRETILKESPHKKADKPSKKAKPVVEDEDEDEDD